MHEVRNDLFIFHGNKMEVTDALKQYVERKVGRVETVMAVEEAVVKLTINGHKHDTHKVSYS
ncbi:HPF/RaiA family ribosome-associated protein [Paenibacillus gyeongsangnamensis]|uniref:HPF/RaiA family ribosome-associated protein n=1 Tax=Paenibacillus gyeongsangnamensis TaxID=3388067 RepID=UPI0039081F60